MTSNDTNPDSGTDSGTGAVNRPGRDTWTAEISVSPEWFAEQESSLAAPATTEPLTVQLLDDYVLIGRLSAAQDIHPIIDAGTDAGCSRRQADLTLTDDGWTLRDLTSVNGTHVLRRGQSFPPDEITEPVVVHDGDEIFVGAWTRIVLHRTPSAS